MAFLQDPRQRRTVAPEADDGGSALPAIPGVSQPQQQAFSGAHQLGAALVANAAASAPKPAQPVTADTPTSVLQRKVAGMRWNFAPGDGMGSGSSWQNSPDGMRTFNSEPDGFLRPRTGPESAAAVGQRTELANLAGRVQVPNLPVQPTLAMPNGTLTSAPNSPTSRPRIAAAAAAAAAAPAATPTVPQLTRGVTAADGHIINGGALVGGVPTFSDGSAGMPATMNAAQVAELGQGRNLSRADAGALAKPLASDALGATPSSDQMVAQRVAQLARPITGSRPSEAQFAAAERNAIASGDWRSAAGTAASNLRMDAQYGGTPRLRRIAEQQLASLATGAQQAGALAQQGEQQQALAGTQAQNALDLEAARGSNELANTALQQRTALLTRPQQSVTLADGTLALQNPVNGTVTLSVGPDGKPAKALVTRDDSATKRTNEIIDQLNKGVQEQLKSYLPTKDAPEPTPEMIAQWREQSARAMGLRLGTDEKGRRVVEINGQVQPL